MHALMQFVQDLRLALRSLMRAKGLSLTVIVTLALGIGANAAIFSLVRGVLLRPLVNADENRLVYIRQSATGMGMENALFSVPDIKDLEASVKTISEFGDFSVIGFTMVGLGEPREVRAGVVGGSYFEVMGLHPVLGRLVGPQDDGPKAPGVVVLTYRFWSTAFKRIRPSSVKPFASIALTRVRPRSSGFSNPAFLIRKTRKSSLTWSPASIIYLQPWLLAAFTA